MDLPLDGVDIVQTIASRFRGSHPEWGLVESNLKFVGQRRGILIVTSSFIADGFHGPRRAATPVAAHAMVRARSREGETGGRGAVSGDTHQRSGDTHQSTRREVSLRALRENRLKSGAQGSIAVNARDYREALRKDGREEELAAVTLACALATSPKSGGAHDGAEALVASDETTCISMGRLYAALVAHGAKSCEIRTSDSLRQLEGCCIGVRASSDGGPSESRAGAHQRRAMEHLLSGAGWTRAAALCELPAHTEEGQVVATVEVGRTQELSEDVAAQMGGWVRVRQRACMSKQTLQGLGASRVYVTELHEPRPLDCGVAVPWRNGMEEGSFRLPHDHERQDEALVLVAESGALQGWMDHCGRPHPEYLAHGVYPAVPQQEGPAVDQASAEREGVFFAAGGREKSQMQQKYEERRRALLQGTAEESVVPSFTAGESADGEKQARAVELDVALVAFKTSEGQFIAQAQDRTSVAFVGGLVPALSGHEKRRRVGTGGVTAPHSWAAVRVLRRAVGEVAGGCDIEQKLRGLLEAACGQEPSATGNRNHFALDYSGTSGGQAATTRSMRYSIYIVCLEDGASWSPLAVVPQETAVSSRNSVEVLLRTAIDPIKGRTVVPLTPHPQASCSGAALEAMVTAEPIAMDALHRDRLSIGERNAVS